MLYSENVPYSWCVRGRTPVVYGRVCRVGFYFRLGSIPNGADPMVEWLVVFLSIGERPYSSVSSTRPAIPGHVPSGNSYATPFATSSQCSQPHRRLHGFQAYTSWRPFNRTTRFIALIVKFDLHMCFTTFPCCHSSWRAHAHVMSMASCRLSASGLTTRATTYRTDLPTGCEKNCTAWPISRSTICVLDLTHDPKILPGSL
ncbi:hypothetical protein BDR22DRAFT_529621 [Usnea florida]